MSSTLVKTKVKAAREAISAKDWTKAEQNASDALTFESSNYNARVLLAVAKLNLGKADESEAAYKAATEAQPTTLLAWQGLASFYEKTSQWPQAVETHRHLADLAKQNDDATKVAEALQKILHLRKEHGTREEVLDVLKLFLPESPYYALLSDLNPPDMTNPTSTTTFEAESLVHNSLPILQEIVEYEEAAERQAIQKEVEKRRQRLTTTTSAEETRKMVMREVMSKSRLPDLYQQIMDHHQASDDIRRELEHRLLQYRYDLLLAIPSPFEDGLASAQTEVAQQQATQARKVAQSQKDEVRNKVERLAADIVTLLIPLELAWMIVLEWRDMKDANDWDVYNFKRYIDLFPDSGLSILAQLVRRLPGPLKMDEEAERAEKLDPSTLTSEVERAFENAQAESVLAHILVSDFYLHLRDFELVADTAQAGIDRARDIERQIGRRLPGNIAILESNLAIALTHLNPPHQHPRALRLLDGLLQRSPNDLRCILARAYIYEHASRWEEAFSSFTQVFNEVDDEKVKLEARIERAWCMANMPAQAESAIPEVHEIATLLDQNPEVDRVRKAKAWWRYGQCLRTVQKEEYQEAAFDAYNTSILRDNTYAPAFTSLGLYYLENVIPPDEEAATKCFQKAFEMDEREELAARKLAESYADSDDWDLVESIARRLVRNLNSPANKYVSLEAPAAGGVTSRKYAWAWKAIGVAELKSKRFERAIPSLQHAVRGLQEDADCWLQLALAYRGSGKHVAALKTLLRVRNLQPSNWHARYLVADIQRQIGLFEEALLEFLGLRSEHPDELVVATAVAETQLALGWLQAKGGFADRCMTSLLECLESCQDLLDRGQAAQRIAWKLVGDALSALADLDVAGNGVALSLVRSLLECLSGEGIDKSNSQLTVVTTQSLLKAVSTKPLSAVCKALAVLAYSMRMLLYSQADDAAGSAWFDLGYALHMLEPRYAALGLERTLQDVKTESIACIRTALQQEPLNGVFWNLLGVLSAESSPKLAQHALVRACELSIRSAVPWTNLGLFYLKHEDYELANKAFLRAQVLDPDYTQAWLGQAALARIHAGDAQVYALVNHAAALSNGALPEADLQAACTVFALHTGVESREACTKAHFQLSRFLRQETASPSIGASAFHLYGLLSERLGYYDQAVTAFEKASNILEALYEESESTEIERQFTMVNISLARGCLGMARYEAAAMAIETALSLLPEDLSSSSSDDDALLKVQALLIRALAAFYSENAQQSIEAFEQARIALVQLDVDDTLESRKQDFAGQVTLLLARVLYALGGEEHLDEAERQLLDNIYRTDSNAPNVPIIAALSAVAIIANKDELLEAALSEIANLPMDQYLAQDPTGEIVFLRACQQILPGHSKTEVDIYSGALHAAPASNDMREAWSLAQASWKSIDLVHEVQQDDSTLAHILHKQPWRKSSI